MDLANIIQTSLNKTFTTDSTVTSSQSSSETVIIKPGEQRFVVPITTNMSGSTTTIQLPSTSTFKEQSLILPANFNATGGPLLCQLDDNSYVLIEGLEQFTTTAPTTTTTNTPTPTTITTSSPTKTSPLSTVKQIGNSFSIPMKSPTTGTAQVKTTPTFITSTINKAVTKGATPSKPITVANQPLINKSPTQGTTKPAFIVRANQHVPTKDSTPLVYTSKSLPVKQTVTNTSITTSPKSCTNMTTTSAGQNSNTPLKYFLIPQSKINSNSPARLPITANATTSGMKTITLNTGSGSNTQTLHLPAGTCLLPSKITTKPTIIKPGISAVINPSKINLQVPPAHSLGKVQSPQIGSTKASEPIKSINLFEDVPTISSEIGQKEPDVPPKSPTLFDMTVDDINEIPSPTIKTKSIITYSRVSPKTTVKLPTPTNEITLKSPSSCNIPTATSAAITKNLSSQSPVVGSSPILPLQYIVPTSASTTKPTPTISTNRKRKSDMKSILDTKKAKMEQSQSDSSKKIPSIGELGTKSGDNMVREVIAERVIQPTDKAIISTAVHEMKKLVARRELLLKQLNSSCLALGKIEYKLTISGAPVDVKQIYKRLNSFQEQYENDLKHLDWAVSAMHKLYSELAPKDETRTTEEILQDLVGPTEGIVDDPAAKYEKFRAPIPKKPRARSPKKPAKKPFYYQGEEGCPESPLKERKVPDKPDPSDGKFHCELCPKIFLKQISLAKHLEFDHPVSLDLEKKLTSSRSPKLPHACENCEKSFHSSVMLSIHRANEHDSMDSYEISRHSRPVSKRSRNDSQFFSDEEWKSPSEDESKPNKNTKKSKITMTTRNAKPVRRVRKPVKRARPTANKIQSKSIDNLDFLFDSDATISVSPQHRLRSNWHEVDLFDPDIPIECTDENPIIPIKALTPETIAAYTGINC